MVTEDQKPGIDAEALTVKLNVNSMTVTARAVIGLINSHIMVGAQQVGGSESGNTAADDGNFLAHSVGFQTLLPSIRA